MANTKSKKKKTEEVIEGEFTPSVLPTTDSLATTSAPTPLTSASLNRFPEPIQKAIIDTAAKIDVMQLEKVMAYGEAPLVRAFENAGKVLKAEQGSAADQEVIRQVIELSKAANQNREEFNLAIQEPGLLEKFLLKIFSSMKEKHDNDVKLKAITNYRLLEQLRDSCDEWLKTLTDSFTSISLSKKNDEDTCDEIEQYIVAGRIAEERIQGEVKLLEQTYNESGLMADKRKHDEMKQGLSTLQLVLFNLEKSRAASTISVGQLSMQEETNKNIQIAVRTQRSHSMLVAAQQLRNAVYNAKNSNALDGQKSITGLNSELMKKISEGTVLTAEESEKALLNGVFTNEAALEAAQTVVAGCKAIAQMREERIDKIEQGLTELKSVLDELSPIVKEIEHNKETKNKSSSSPATSGLVF